MRLPSVSILSFVVLVWIFGAPSDLGTTFSRPAQAVRTPPTTSGNPGGWTGQPSGKKSVDVTALKAEANDLITMTQALPTQIEQLGGNKLPKELIDNLKKIEKLSKHIRSEIE